jgi:glycosyltransferase involved in cell wall biosynthesis
MSQPFFTIILPNYKTEGFLEECLMSVKNQTFDDFECVLINDGSPGLDQDEIKTTQANSDYSSQVDLTKISPQDQWQVIYDFVTKGDGRFRCINKENGGQGSCRNLGMDQAKGRFVLFLDCDDTFESEHLQSVYTQLMRLQDRWDDSVFLFDNVREFKMVNGQKVWNEEPMIAQKPKHLTYENYLVLNQNGLTCSTIQISTLGSTRFTWLTKSMEDVEILYRLGAHFQEKKSKLRFIAIPIDTIHRRLHSGSMTFADSQAGFEKEKVDKINAYQNLLDNERLTFQQRVLCRLGVWRFGLVGKYGKFGTFFKKILTFIAKIISGWYI